MGRIRDKGRAEGLLIGVLVGALIAAITSLLFAPKSGKDLRKDIGDGTHKALEQADEYLDVARKKGASVVDDASKAASSYFNMATKKVDEVTEEAVDKAEELMNN